MLLHRTALAEHLPTTAVLTTIQDISSMIPTACVLSARKAPPLGMHQLVEVVLAKTKPGIQRNILVKQEKWAL